MAWISVYQEVDGPKLRKLSKSLDCSKAEALGILNFLWFWGMNNADETGKVLEAEIEDVEDALSRCTDIEADKVVEGLFTTGWLDEDEGNIYIHDWDTWQEQWYKLQKKRKYDSNRKRIERQSQEKQPEIDVKPEEQDAVAIDEQSPEENQDTPEEPQTPSKKKSKKKKDEEPDKVKYADFVNMTEERYGRLLESYGEEFTAACIAKLNVYKGSKGKQYKDDYLAILSWVVDEIKTKCPGLLERSKSTIPRAEDGDDNPFRDWREDAG